MATGADETRSLEPAAVRERTDGSSSRTVARSGSSRRLPTIPVGRRRPGTPPRPSRTSTRSAAASTRSRPRSPTAIRTRPRADAEITNENEPRRTDAAVDPDDPETS
ncbi:hypothetical protein [Natronococcus jeotgali]|uniref:Uncharacterized protein n=1 Tax=Natronococcus jeotgali DSM 18795 TaxID=1227498 RepID=L9XD47_9EURY|nr:hypothetical protein [Natronococcus jeotgali]ELY58528.1 hypothetical protein C492_11955 [Natronococcus jeotgali DSM 18795]